MIMLVEAIPRRDQSPLLRIIDALLKGPKKR